MVVACVAGRNPRPCKRRLAPTSGRGNIRPASDNARQQSEQAQIKQDRGQRQRRADGFRRGRQRAQVQPQHGLDGRRVFRIPRHHKPGTPTIRHGRPCVILGFGFHRPATKFLRTIRDNQSRAPVAFGAAFAGALRVDGNPPHPADARGAAQTNRCCKTQATSAVRRLAYVILATTCGLLTFIFGWLGFSMPFTDHSTGVLIFAVFLVGLALLCGLGTHRSWKAYKNAR